MLESAGHVRYEGLPKERDGRDAPEQRTNDGGAIGLFLVLLLPNLGSPFNRLYDIWVHWISPGIARMDDRQCVISLT
jgi:hypothetical protein